MFTAVKVKQAASPTNNSYLAQHPSSELTYMMNKIYF